MISFMVISGERSGSTWAANWLTTDTTLCIHDPLRRYTLNDLQYNPKHPGKRIGVSCTALQLAPQWVNYHAARKVIIHRPEQEIAASFARLGVEPFLVEGTNARLDKLDGFHVHYRLLFDPKWAKDIAEHLGVPFDAERHAELVQMNVQPHFPSVKETDLGSAELLERIRNFH